MNIMKMVFKIILITYDMVPKTFLPKVDMIGHAEALFIGSGKTAFHGMHDLAEITFTIRLDKHVKMIG